MLRLTATVPLPAECNHKYGHLVCNAQSVDALSEAAKAAQVTLVGGSIPERSDGKTYNTCCVVGPDGKLLAKHRKVKLIYKLQRRSQ